MFGIKRLEKRIANLEIRFDEIFTCLSGIQHNLQLLSAKEEKQEKVLENVERLNTLVLEMKGIAGIVRAGLRKEQRENGS